MKYNFRSLLKFPSEGNYFKKIAYYTNLFLLITAIVFVIVIFQSCFIFNDFNEHMSNVNNMLLAIIGASATILAIVFTLSQFILSNVAKKYSPKVFEEYENNPDSFKLFIFYIIIISVSLFFFLTNDKLTAPLEGIYFFVLSFIIFMFIISFILLIRYIEMLFLYVNPFKYGDYKESLIIKDMVEKEDKVRENIKDMGDISIKSIISEEDSVTLYYIDKLNNIFLESIKEENEPNEDSNDI